VDDSIATNQGKEDTIFKITALVNYCGRHQHSIM